MFIHMTWDINVIQVEEHRSRTVYNILSSLGAFWLAVEFWASFIELFYHYQTRVRETRR